MNVWALTAAFSWATVLIASGPLRAFRLSFPFYIYWLVVAAASAAFWFAGAPVIACVLAASGLVVGLFTEFRMWHLGRGVAATGAIVALMAAVGAAFGAWCREMKISPVTWLTQVIEPMVVKFKAAYPTAEIEVDAIIYQLPSALVLLGLISIAAALVSEQSWLRMGGSNRRSEPWNEFKLSDFAIYLLMLALLAALTRHGVPAITSVGANVLNVLVLLYFFQGMAVVFKAFDVFKVGLPWRVLIGLILTFQLALLVAVVGVADYWLEFRNRLTRRPVGPKAEL